MMSRKSKSEGKCEGERFVWGCKEGKVPQSREGTGGGERVPQQRVVQVLFTRK